MDPMASPPLEEPAEVNNSFRTYIFMILHKIEGLLLIFISIIYLR